MHWGWMRFEDFRDLKAFRWDLNGLGFGFGCFGEFILEMRMGNIFIRVMGKVLSDEDWSLNRSGYEYGWAGFRSFGLFHFSLIQQNENEVSFR